MDGNVNEMSRYLSEASKYNLSNSGSKLEKTPRVTKENMTCGLDGLVPV